MSKSHVSRSSLCFALSLRQREEYLCPILDAADVSHQVDQSDVILSGARYVASVSIGVSTALASILTNGKTLVFDAVDDMDIWFESAEFTAIASLFSHQIRSTHPRRLGPHPYRRLLPRLPHAHPRGRPGLPWRGLHQVLAACQ